MLDQDKSIHIGDWIIRIVVSDPPWYQNGYVVVHQPSGETVVIDPGASLVSFETAVDDLQAIREIWLTHGHPDHISGARALQEAHNNLHCLAHQAEKTVLNQAEAMGRMLAMQVQAPLDIRYFDDKTGPTLGGEAVQVLHAPGHTPGGVCYAFPGFAFTGDTLFNHGVGRTDLPGGDAQALAQSISNILETLPGETMLFSGHGGAWKVSEAKNWWQWMV